MVDYESLYEKCIKYKQSWINGNHFYFEYYKKNKKDADYIYLPEGFDKNTCISILKSIVNDSCFGSFESEEVNNYYKLLKFMDENE